MITVRDFKQSIRRMARPCIAWRKSAPVIAWSLLIFVLSSVPGNQYPQVSWQLADKAVHFSLYLVLGLFAALWFISRGFSWWAPLLYGLLYGVSDELHQVWVPMRSPSISDWYADAAGVFAGVISFYLLSIYLNSTHASSSESTATTDSMELT